MERQEWIQGIQGPMSYVAANVTVGFSDGKWGGKDGL